VVKLDTIYNNAFLNLLLTVIYATVAISFGSAVISLTTDPLVIETGAVSENISFLNYIITPDVNNYAELRGSYQTYMQKAILTPIGYHTIILAETALCGIDKSQTSLLKEKELSKSYYETFNVFYLNEFKKIEIHP